MTRPIRVAQIVCSSGSAGVEAHLVALLGAFDRAEVDPVLFVPGPGPLIDRLRARDLAFEFGAPTRKLAYAETRALARRWSGAFDIVHAHGQRAIFWATIAARHAKLPIVATIHELRWLSMAPSLKRTLWIALEQWALERAGPMIAVSQTTANDLLARRPEWRDRLTVVEGSTPMLLDADRLPHAAPARRTDEPMRLITVGRLEWGKGYDILFHALAGALERGLDWTLHVVGQGSIASELRALATQLGLDGRIRWEDASSELAARMGEAHAFVTGTRSEALPVATLEAMAIGLPVVAPAVGGMTELIVNGESGILVEPLPEDARAARLADAIVALAGDPERARRVGEAAARRARDRFGPARMAAGVAQVYRRSLATPLR